MLSILNELSLTCHCCQQRLSLCVCVFFFTPCGLCGNLQEDLDYLQEFLSCHGMNALIEVARTSDERTQQYVLRGKLFQEDISTNMVIGIFLSCSLPNPFNLHCIA